MSAMLRLAGRESLSRATYTRVGYTARTFHTTPVLRQRFPVLTPELRPEWNQLLAQTGQVVQAGITDLLSRLFGPTPATPAAPPAPTGPQRVNSKQLLPSDLVRLLDESTRYVCHRTNEESVGTCQAPLRAETDQSRMKNPMAPFGVYATVGVQGIADYGQYGIVYDRFGDLFWAPHDPPAVRAAVDSIAPDRAVGWFLQKHLEEALKSRPKR
ncbi:hypothetical protein ACFFQW_39375 [Umezawaea endophytica]|uniref:Uncharacterized protein n=1 Tax=Umezawaea endophytica TaxID=1654476 RepID=A0A9X2VN44_9PSEU|nr:hypothetical protein [Umezawaea endophytica]MCS7479502.1 hypothetical protein [Umezawaea endophytica]